MLAAGMLAAGGVKGQDVHFSQFYETTVLRNPGLTGIFTEDFKVGASYRNQWANVGRPYQTGFVSGECRLPVGRSGADFVSLGLLGYYDQAGAVGLKTTGVYPAVNYNKSLEDRHSSYLSLGFTAGYLQRSFDPSKATWDNMYQAGLLVPGSGGGVNTPRVSHWDLGTGVSFNSGIGENDRLTYFIGLSAYHFTRPSNSFFSSSDLVRLSTRWNASLGFNVQLDDIWSIQAHANYSRQGGFNETIGGGFLRWNRLDERNERAFAFNAGCFYRLADAIIPTIRIDYKGESLGISYDINVSGLKATTRMRGGFELTAFINGYYNGNGEDKRLCPRF